MKLSLETWIVPLQVVSAVFVEIELTFIAMLKVTDILGCQLVCSEAVLIPVPSEGVVVVTVGATGVVVVVVLVELSALVVVLSSFAQAVIKNRQNKIVFIIIKLLLCLISHSNLSYYTVNRLILEEIGKCDTIHIMETFIKCSSLNG
ncbi:MAG: hypothetical protein KDC52_01280 [Ignavibacteriae bacterium]|nr:hypothetical protein [Ignavibacteriota bacterium]